MSSSFTEFPEEILLEVNRVCNRFETAWRAGEDPNLKAALEELPEKYRGAALLELLPIDVEWRRRSQLPIDVDGYCQRFPGVDRERIAEICGGASSDNSVSDTAATPSSTQKRTRTTEDIPRTIGDYEIVDQIGQGGMGAVYRAVHVRMDRTVALKVIQPEIAKDPQLIQRFEREVRVAAKLTHPNIVAALDAREEDGIYCLITEFIDGQDLNTLVKKNGPMSVSAVVDVLIQAATGLEYAHQRGVIHRDIKPANLLLDRDRTVKILDMGLARIDAEASSPQDSSDLTASGMVIGTAAYMSPEQARNTKNADARSDIYSLGCTLYFLLTGRPAYRGDTVVDTILAHVHEPIPELRRALPDDQLAGLVEIFEKMVAKRPDERFSSMAEVAQAIEAWQQKSPSSRLSRGSQRPDEPSAPAAMNEGFPELQEPPLPQRKTKQKIPGIVPRRQIIAGVAVGIFVLGLAIWPWFPSPDPDNGADNDGNVDAGQTTQPPPSPSTAWKTGPSLQFNGWSSYAATPSLVPDPTQPVTLEAVVSYRTAQTSNILSWLGPEWMALFLSHEGRFGISRLHEGQSLLLASDDRMRPDQIFHVAGIWDGSALRLYVNGTAVPTSPIPFTLPETHGGLYIGGVPRERLPTDQNNRFFDGHIYAVRISRGVRYPEEFTPPFMLEPDANALAVYQFDEGAGDTLYDATGNGHDANIVDAIWITDER